MAGGEGAQGSRVPRCAPHQPDPRGSDQPTFLRPTESQVGLEWRGTRWGQIR